MNRKFHALFRDLGVTDRADRLEVTGYVVGRQLASSNELSFDDGRTLIDTMESWLAGEGFAEGIRTADDQIREILNAAALRDADS